MASSSVFFASGGEGYELQMGRWSRRLAPSLEVREKCQKLAPFRVRLTTPLLLLRQPYDPVPMKDTRHAHLY